MAQDARKFKYNSDYPQPLVVYRQQFTLAPTTPVDPVLFKFEHHLPYTPLVIAKASFNSDFSTSSDISTGGNLGIHSPMEILADATYIYIILFPDNNMTINYVRVIGYAPCDFDGNISTVQNDSSFRFNSDYDYAGCIQGKLTQGELMEVNHNLGYAPQCRSWSWNSISIPGTSIDVSGYSASSYSAITRYSSGVRLYQDVSTSSQYIIYKRSDGESRVGQKPIYYHIYTLEG